VLASAHWFGQVCGYEAYKTFITAGWALAKDKGLYLGSLDETTLENIRMIKDISGLGEVSFHMSGTEAVMAAVRCARFNMKKPLVVTFGGAYHGWWDGMQPAAGNERTPTDVLCLKDMNALSLAVIAGGAHPYERASARAASHAQSTPARHLECRLPQHLAATSASRLRVAPPRGTSACRLPSCRRSAVSPAVRLRLRAAWPSASAIVRPLHVPLILTRAPRLLAANSTLGRDCCGDGQPTPMLPPQLVAAV
jgi:hypothetical protein